MARGARPGPTPSGQVRSMSADNQTHATNMPLLPERNPFAEPGEWFKGNLHLHTTNSDGDYSPQATVDLYAQEGYDFLAITDHNRLTDPEDVDGHGMVLLPGVEFDGGRGELGQTYHMVALGVQHEVQRLDAATSQEALDQTRSHSEIVFLAHPYWSSLTAEDLMAVEGYDGIEVFNTTCERGIGRGHSEPQWDNLLTKGRLTMAMAVDDAHFHYWDTLGGWVWVKTPRLEYRGLMDSIKRGFFYASSGPEINNVVFADDTVHVECSPVASVALVVASPGKGWTTDRLRDGGDRPLITEANLPSVHDLIFRIEVTDERGNRAWTNPYKIKS